MEKMDYNKIVELLIVLKKIYVCEMAGFNRSFDLIKDVDINDLNAFLENNGINTLEVLESCYNVEYVLENELVERGCEKTLDGVREFFGKYEGIMLSDKEANGIYEKYLNSK